MNKLPLRLAQAGILIGLIIMVYGRLNIRNEDTLINSLTYAVTVIYAFSIPNAYVVFKNALKSKLHSKSFTVIVLAGYILIPILFHFS